MDAPDDDGHASAIKRVLGEHDQALRMLNSKSSCIGESIGKWMSVNLGDFKDSGKSYFF